MRMNLFCKKMNVNLATFFAHWNRTLVTISHVSYLKSATPLRQNAAWVIQVIKVV